MNRAALLPLSSLLLAGCGGAIAAPEGAPNVVLVVVDTLRADHLSCYGHDANTTPNLDAFAREGVLFEDVTAPAPHTAPSHASLFTSATPAAHGVWNEVKTSDGATVLPRLAPAATTLAEVFAGNGYATAAIADGGWIQENRGLHQGFDHFDSEWTGVRDRVDRAVEWLDDAADGARPFFLFLHTYEVHRQLLPEPGYEDRFAPDYDGPMRAALADARAAAAAGEGGNPFVHTFRHHFKPILLEGDPADIAFYRALYEAELSLVDEELARFFGHLRAAGLWDETVVVVTSDHGEEFFEHGRHSHDQLYEECLRVPLLARVPGGPRGARRADPVELVDLMPSLLGLVGIEAPPSATGRDVGLDEGVDRGATLQRVAEVNAPDPQVAVRDGAYKVLFEPESERQPRVFDLANDPGETTPLEGQDARVSRARLAVQAWRSTGAVHAERFALRAVLEDLDGLDEDDLAELRAMGYLGDE